jgi:hypothetical protein
LFVSQVAVDERDFQGPHHFSKPPAGSKLVGGCSLRGFA